MSLVFAKFNNKTGVCETVYKYTFPVKINKYSGFHLITDEKLKKKIAVDGFKLEKEGIRELSQEEKDEVSVNRKIAFRQRKRIT